TTARRRGTGFLFPQRGRRTKTCLLPAADIVSSTGTDRTTPTGMLWAPFTRGPSHYPSPTRRRRILRCAGGTSWAIRIRLLFDGDLRDGIRKMSALQSLCATTR